MELLFIDLNFPQATLVQKQLEKYKYQVICASTLSAAEEQLKSRYFDVLLLNDGQHEAAHQVSFLKNIRQLQPTVILLLAGHWDTAEQRIQALEMGVDDCLTFPVDAREITLRVQRLLLRRPERTNFSGFEMNVVRRELIWKMTNERIVLTERNFDLLALFASQSNQIIDREALSRHIYGRAWDPKDRGVDVAVSNLRCKLRQYQRSESLIRSVRGRGYVMIIRGA